MATQYGRNRKGGKETRGGTNPLVWVLGAATVIAVGTVAWSGTRTALSEAALAPIEIVFADVSELVAMATGVEKGDPDAEILIMEFGDFQCPSCQHFATNVKPQMDLAYVDTGVARFVFHDFPLSIHPHAFLASRAARCALDQGSDRYWPYHDLLFRNQPAWSASPGPPLAVFESYAEQIGLNSSAFSSCLNSDRFADVVTANLRLGNELGVGRTPTIYVSRGGGTSTEVQRWSEISGIQEIIERYQVDDEAAQEGEAGN